MSIRLVDSPLDMLLQNPEKEGQGDAIGFSRNGDKLVARYCLGYLHDRRDNM